MHRNETLTDIAQETMDVLKRGCFQGANGELVNITAMLNTSVQGTRWIKAADFGSFNPPAGGHDTRFLVESTSVLTLARQSLSRHQEVIALNAPVISRRGAGFLAGIEGPEEQLCRATGLYANLQNEQPFYDGHLSPGSGLMTDDMLFAPCVPVIRNENNKLAHESPMLSIVTSPAVDYSRLQSDEFKQAKPIMKKRIRKFLLLCSHFGYESVVVGAWGCGLEGNDPREIAANFHSFLGEGGEFASVFKSVGFAIPTKNELIRQPFVELFGH